MGRLTFTEDEFKIIDQIMTDKGYERWNLIGFDETGDYSVYTSLKDILDVELLLMVLLSFTNNVAHQSQLKGSA
jgi:hypothetical protein